MRESLKQLLIGFMIGLMLCPPSLVFAGGIQVDTSAPAANQATMDAAQNGVPVVNIAAPGGNGMSHNMFTDFNVGSQGVILNNSVAPGVSQLGGALAQNPNLGGQAASTILNEVTGTGRSSIEGFTEIFGQSANYILANPNGISINGGGFINTSKTTMATGTPQFSGGVFQGLDVRGGDILIHGAGVNAANIDAFEVVTRAAQINADIHAKRLSIVTGQNRHNLVSGTTTPLAPDGSPAPAISIDSSALGGMYAGRITLVGTEAGVGVNTKGLVQSTEHLEMTVDGKIQVTNTVTSSGTMTLTSQDSIDVSGTVKAVGTATLNAPTVTVAKVDPADSPIISGGALAINAGTLNNEQLIAADTAATIAATTLNNTGTIYSGGTATFRIGDRLYNNRGTILAKNDMLLEGAVAGQKMATLQNDSGTIESLDGGLVVRATTLNNTTLGTVVNAAATSVAGSAKGGIYYVYGDKANRGQTMYQEMGGTGSAPANAYVVSSGEWYLWDLIGLGPKRVVTWDEFDAVHQAFDTSSLSATDLTYFNNLRSNILGKSGQYIIKGTTAWQDSGAYFAQTFEDELVSRGIAGKFLAHTGLAVEADALTTNQGVFQTTQGDLSITADTITYDGFTLYRRELVKWAVGKANNHGGSWLERHDSGQESILDPMSTLRNSFVSGGSVLITANSITGQDEFRDPNTIVNAPDPAAQAQKVADVTTLTDALPANGLFQPNANPAQNYLIETNPALTNLDTFYGSDYALSRMGFDPNAEANKRLGDAFFETRLVREQIFELSGLRFLDAAVTTDTAQMVALMDNAVQARTDLNLSVGIALSADQVAALTSDIIWFEYQEVNGQQVLVPVVYLGSASLLKLAQGDSIIIGDEVRIATTGDTANTASIVAKNGLEITAANFLNMPGSAVRSSDVSIAATESIRNTGGSIAGNTVSLTAGQDVVIASETLAKTSQHGSETVVSRTGSVTATGDLTIEAGENVGILGARVESGGDTTLKAGESVAISTIETQMRHSVAESQFNARTDATANTGSTVTAGGALSIEAGQDTAIHGSRVESGGDTDIMAGGSVAITAAQNTWDGTYYGKRGSGGLFGGGKGSESSEVRGVAAKQSTLASGGSVTVQAGAAGSGDVVLQGSQVTAGQDATLKAEGDIQATATRTENYSKFQEEKSGFMGTKSMASDESSSVAHTRPEIEAGGKVTLDAKQDVILQAARITSGDATEITAQDGHVAMLVVKDSEYKREVKSDTGFFSWSSKDQGSLDETVQHTEIFAEKGLTLTTAEGVTVEYKETGNLQQDIAQLAQAPGLEWMAEVAARDDVNWQAVQEVHDQWSKSDSGIGGPGMQLVSLAMAVALSMTGVGTGVAGTLIGSAQGGSAFGAWAAANGLHGALTTSLAAGFNALVMQAGMQVIGNGGDIGAALQALASIDTVRMLATTMLTAGLTHGLMDAANLGGDSALLSQAEDMSQTLDILTEELQRAAIRGGVSVGVDTAINGGDIGQNLAFQMRAAGVAVLGKQGARAIGTAFKDQQIDTVKKYIAHAALGGAMDIAMGGDGTSGALGAVTGEFIADSYVNAWIGDKLADPASMSRLEGDALKAELKKLEGEIAELRGKGVDIARLGAGMAAALTGGDINTAAQTGGNAAEHNALPLLLVIYGACEAVDAGIKLYNAYKLAEAIQNQDEEAIFQYGSEIVMDSAIGAVPLSGVFTKLGMTKVGAMVLALGNDAAKTAAKFAEKVVIDNMPAQLKRITTSGIELVAKPGKTTTVLGRYTDDMKDVIGELDYPKTLDFDAKPSGFNVLNAPDELYKNSDQFWKEYNKPFLDAAIERGDDIVLATKPGPDTFTILKDGKLTDTGFKREYDYLKDNGYIYDATTSKMIKR